MSFEFSEMEGEEMTLDNYVFQALGAVSVCWEDIDKAGIFESERAREIGHALMAKIEELSECAVCRSYEEEWDEGLGDSSDS